MYPHKPLVVLSSTGWRYDSRESRAESSSSGTWRQRRECTGMALAGKDGTNQNVEPGR
ncbi:hypothetical protein AG1IA_09823 [Rhizoctonia solani AG-1 IA]|uniref:Uncharacterized protein n=1 Tax=Thanatephorus cucumeris (strain AG1-IA) TaxID=983506 RepID=L8WHE2_THACA|nr:hypothetical protein AG1IA_09823 [Rhizoctonia solani AG-1 IA]